MRKDIDLEYLNNLLQEKLAVIIARRKGQEEDEAPVKLDQSKVGRISRMDAIQQQAMAKASGRRTEIERKRIIAALDRIQSGAYGYCLKCEEEIAEARLRFDPSAFLCISCAQYAERK